MNFSSIGRSSNFSQAGKSAADETVKAFAASRRNAPKYDKIAEDAVKMRSKEKIAAMKAEQEVAMAGVKAKTDVKSFEIKNQAAMKRDKSKRKAGALAVAGKMFGQAGQFIDEPRTKRDIGTDDSWYDSQIKSTQDSLIKYGDLLNDDGTFKNTSSSDTSGGDGTGKATSPTDTTGGPKVSTNISAQHASGPGKLSKAQIKQYALDAGFDDSSASTVVGIAGGESGFDPSNSTERSGLMSRTGEDSVGLMQINWGYHKDKGWLQKLGITSREQLFDPATNMKAAKYLYDGRGNFGDWTVYDKGIYKDYL